MPKPFKLAAQQIAEIAPGRGACVATDHITVEGRPIGYMYREEPDLVNTVDSGWRFFSGLESQEYVDEAANWEVFDVNIIANYDQAILPYLDLPIGAELERDESGSFFRIDLSSN
jgi:hypothetical protein